MIDANIIPKLMNDLSKELGSFLSLPGLDKLYILGFTDGIKLVLKVLLRL